MSHFDDPRAYWNEQAGPRWVRASAVLDRIMAPITARLLEASAAAAGERVLDVGCGAGATTVALADRVGAGGSVLAVDISEPLAARARERLGDRGEVVVADAETHGFSPTSRELAASRFGVMFFADSAAAFANIGGALVDGGRLAFVCWQAMDRNPWISFPVAAAGDAVEAAEMPAGDRPGPFRFADRDAAPAALERAGFADIAVEPFELDLELAGAPAEILDLYLEVGPLSRAIEGLEGAARERVLARVLAELERRHDGERIALGAAMWVVTARRR